MDVGELLSFKPKKLVAKQSTELEVSNDVVPRKMQRLDYKNDSKTNKRSTRLQLPPASENKMSSVIKKSILSKKIPPKTITQQNDTPIVAKQQESVEERQMRLLAEVESQMSINNDQQLDEHKVKKLILSFEKKACKNQEMRIKFADNPEKFMESELDLNDSIIEMKSLSIMPNHYHYLVALNAITSLLSLLGHPNADIATSVIDLLQELTDNEDESLDDNTGETNGTLMLIEALIGNRVCALLVQNLERLDEQVPEEANGVYNSLGLLENILDLKPESALLFTKEGLLTWSLKRLKAKIPFNSNKLYVSEIISIILQNETQIQQQLGEADGIDTILQQLATFKRYDPSNSEEVEFMENMFNCLCSALLLDVNREKFLNGEGLQLMNLMLREKKISRNSALKVLDHAMSGADGVSNCLKFVDILGLRTLFPLFMKPPKKNKKIGSTVKDHEEHIVSIIASMLQNLKGSHKQRLVSKFSEKDFAKVDRLIELHFKYMEKIQREEAKLEREREKLLQLLDGDEEQLEEDFYLRRLDAGLFTLQQVDYIIVDISSYNSQIKQRILRILNMKGGTVKSVRAILKEYSCSIDDKNSTSANVLRQKIIALADKF